MWFAILLNSIPQILIMLLTLSILLYVYYILISHYAFKRSISHFSNEKKFDNYKYSNTNQKKRLNDEEIILNNLNNSSYKVNKKILKNEEIEFYNKLYEATKDKFIIIAKPRLIDIFKVEFSKNKNYKNWLNNILQIRSIHFDYVLCNKMTFNIVCAIDLNDRICEYKEIEIENKIKKSICESAMLIHICFGTDQIYTTDSLNEIIDRNLNIYID